VTLHPRVEPYESGMLDVGDGNVVYWESSGNPHGKPAALVHGGPGAGSNPETRRHLDPRVYRIVGWDQRGCGASLPHASDPATDMSVNTTTHLVADMERLRAHLGIDTWLLFGGSWGSTLMLAYAERYPERVSEIVIRSVTTSERTEIDWLYYGLRRFFPSEWEEFRASAAPVARGGDLLTAYDRLLANGDAAVREAAAEAWLRWEDAVISLEPHGLRNVYSRRPAADRVALARICAHYFSRGAFLEEGVLLRHTDRLAGIPGVLVQGRLDLDSPPLTAWQLATRWPDAQLVLVLDAGHTGSPAMTRAVVEALRAFGA